MVVTTAPSILTAAVRSLGAIRGAATMVGLGGWLQISTRLGLEFRFAARAAEQHFVAVMRCAMGRIRFHRHAADRVARAFGRLMQRSSSFELFRKPSTSLRR